MIPDDEPQNWRDIVRADHITLIEIADESGLHERTIAEALGGYVKTKPATEARIRVAVAIIASARVAESERRQVDRRETSHAVPEDRRREPRRLIDKMACPVCGSEQSRVQPYRPRRLVEGCFGRVRECSNGHRFETLEQVSHLPRLHKVTSS